MRVSPSPSATAASTNARAFSCRVDARTIRAVRGKYTSAMAMTSLRAPNPRAATSAIASRIAGNAISPSRMRVTTLSTFR